MTPCVRTCPAVAREARSTARDVRDNCTHVSSSARGDGGGDAAWLQPCSKHAWLLLATCARHVHISPWARARSGGPRHVAFAQMAEAKRAKHARLNSLRCNLPFMSQSALAAVLKAAREEKLLAATRRDIREARDADCQQMTPYGKLHKGFPVMLKTGRSLQLEIQSPQAMLWHMRVHNSSFADLISRTYAAKPCTRVQPWRLLLYSDEILPGSALAYNATRKSWGWYWSIMELGPQILSNEDPKRVGKLPHVVMRAWVLGCRKFGPARLHLDYGSVVARSCSS